MKQIKNNVVGETPRSFEPIFQNLQQISFNILPVGDPYWDY